MSRASLSLLFFLFSFPLESAETRRAIRGNQDPPGLPFEQYLTQDDSGQQVTFYLSTEPKGVAAPLALFVQGTGAYSHFALWAEKKKFIVVHHEFLEGANGDARVLLVEKPGIPFGYWPSDRIRTDKAPETFRRDYTLARWAETLRAAIESASSLSSVKKGRVLVVGHSEGSQVAELPFLRLSLTSLA